MTTKVVRYCPVCKKNTEIKKVYIPPFKPERIEYHCLECGTIIDAEFIDRS